MRMSRDEYFMTIAFAAAQRGTCNRIKVGCAIVKDGEIISTGYNGSAAGEPHCIDVGCEMVEGHCIATIHAEDNAIRLAGREARGSVLYVTDKPCYVGKCAKRIVNARIAAVYYCRDYKSPQTDVLFLRRGIRLTQLEMPEFVRRALESPVGGLGVSP